MTLELRILSGLHRGVCLPIDEETPLTLGGSDDCDVMLVDPALQGLSWTIVVDAEGWSGGSTDSDDAPQRRSIGAALDIAGVRVQVCTADAGWDFDLADRGTRGAAPAEALPDIHSVASPAGPATRPSIDPTTLKNCKFVPHDAGANRRRWVRRAALGTLIAGAAGVALSNARTSPESGEADARLKPTFSAAEAARWAARHQQQPMAIDPMPSASDVASARSVSDLDELRRLLQQRLEDADLFRRLDINTSGTSWQLSGDLNAEDEQRLARVVAQFIRDYRPRVEIQAKVLSAEELLPFDIKQLMSGPMASVVTTDDVRLFPGDSHRGYTLAKIEGRRITFVGGRRTVEVAW